MIEKLCKNCVSWSIKGSDENGDGIGKCINPKVIEQVTTTPAEMIQMLVPNIHESIAKEIAWSMRFSGDFGCIHFELAEWKLIEAAIKPESELEYKIIMDDIFEEGALSGEPRKGHPEGKVIYHIGHVLENIDKLSNVSTEERTKLRLIALFHDIQKFKTDRTIPRAGTNHHGWLAKEYAKKFINDQEILEIIELHDSAWNAYQKWTKNPEKGEIRAKLLIDVLGVSIGLYMKFFQCDNNTGDKISESYTWFEKMVEKYKNNG